MNLEFINNRIKEIGIKKSFIAKKLGMTKQNFSLFITGKINLQCKYIPKLAEILRVEIKDLFLLEN